MMTELSMLSVEYIAGLLDESIENESRGDGTVWCITNYSDEFETGGIAIKRTEDSVVVVKGMHQDLIDMRVEVDWMELPPTDRLEYLKGWVSMHGPCV